MWKYLIDFKNAVADATFLLQLLASSFAGVLVLGNRNNGKEKSRKIWIAGIETILLFGGTLLLEILFFMIFFSNNRLNAVRGMAFSLPVLIGFCIFAAIRSSMIVREKVTLVWMVFSSVLVMMEWSAPYGIAYLFQEAVLENVVEIAADILMILFACFIRRFSITQYYITRMDALLNCVEAWMVTFMALIHESMPDMLGFAISRSVRIYIFAVFMMLYFMNILTYFFTYEISKNRQQIMESKLIEQKKSAELELAELSAQNLQELRKIRHDLKNQYLYMKMMLEKKQYKELKEYFEKYTGKISSQLFHYIDYGNREVSAVMHMERCKAEKYQIEWNANIAVPQLLGIDGSDLCSLLTNLLDNAIEECMRLESEAGKIYVIMNAGEKGEVYICVMNTTEKEDAYILAQGLRSKKMDKINHGFGIEIIQKIVQKYDGHFHMNIENKKFIAEVLLNTE